MDHDPLRRGIAEFVGTFTPIFIGAGSILTLTTLFLPAISGPQAQGVYGGLTLVAVAFAHGLAIAVMVSAVGHISGGHFNPAVTLGFVITRRLAPSLAVVYWSVQFLAAAAAALLLKWFYPENVRAISNLGSPALGSGVSVWQGVVIELVLTFFLVWVIFATAADPGGAFKSIAGLAIGLTITLDILMGGPLTGAAMHRAPRGSSTATSVTSPTGTCASTGRRSSRSAAGGSTTSRRGSSGRRRRTAAARHRSPSGATGSSAKGHTRTSCSRTSRRI